MVIKRPAAAQAKGKAAVKAKGKAAPKRGERSGSAADGMGDVTMADIDVPGGAGHVEQEDGFWK